ncbi:hypothetical protein [Flavobacterium lindanitolerans]|uniref:hypothetical protein n=1 Tax=Flavobacterium lindanitolerans TaxID=428988 RepID=UPI0023F0C4B3|nr:hypothetical protein [Flavobacterium lindanitolerans]
MTMLFLLGQKLAWEIWFTYLQGVKTPIDMSNHILDFNGFPTNNSSSPTSNTTLLPSSL